MVGSSGQATALNTEEVRTFVTISADRVSMRTVSIQKNSFMRCALKTGANPFSDALSIETRAKLYKQ